MRDVGSITTGSEARFEKDVGSAQPNPPQAESPERHNPSHAENHKDPSTGKPQTPDPARRGPYADEMHPDMRADEHNHLPLQEVGPRTEHAESHADEDDDSHSTSTLSSALSSRHEREAAESAIGSANPTPAQEEKEPDPGPPLLGEGALGLQQLLMGSKEAKEITMSTLYSASPSAIKAWRRKRKAYLKEVRIYNAGHAIKRGIRPVKDFVDEVIWEAVSKKKLHPHHRTHKRQDPNHIECANYFLGVGEYKGLIQEDHKDPLVVLKAVKYQKGRSRDELVQHMRTAGTLI